MEDTDRDFFMSAQEAVEYGLIDAVIEHPTHLAVNSSGIPMFASEF
jgi:ATP-dependent Clp protease, protease subunit